MVAEAEKKHVLVKIAGFENLLRWTIIYDLYVVNIKCFE